MHTYTHMLKVGHLEILPNQCICLGRVRKKKKGRKKKILEKNPQADGSHKNTGAGTTTVVTLIAPIVR